MTKKLLSVALCLSCISVFFRFQLLDAYVLGETVYRCGGGEKKQIALTFDDGPHPDHTPIILSILEEYNIPATFFVIGENAHQHPELVKKESDMGYEIGNHTYSHPKIKETGFEKLLSEANSAHQEILKITGRSPTIFRPPGGVCDQSVGMVADQNQYSVILWTVDTEDWQNPPVQDIVNRVISGLRPGAIILFHDYIWGDSPTPEALRILIPFILDKGYEFVTVSDLLGI